MCFGTEWVSKSLDMEGHRRVRVVAQWSGELPPAEWARVTLQGSDDTEEER